ncbi:hypothetical protein A7U60_g7044 [Sanghuangporus baumii]|uniref:Fe2OG dioxygenase domain-containing protein n=1 Tax=Sanghuangporus baumii TaxID=108892 RepID=A0A9Q5HTZ9_SANBA|nr:hypothetical protein A7U60_g7044 [Sanghuangporus baumii]
MDMTEPNLSLNTIDSDGIPQAYYIPEFISEDEERYLLRQIYNAPKPKWKNLENRRLQVWGGDLAPSSKLLAQALPSFLTKYPDIVGRLQATGAFSKSKHGAPNHVIVNEYLPLQGIMPHEDGPSYHPVVATISLGSHTVFHYYRYKTESCSGAPRMSDSPSDHGQINDADPTQKSSPLGHGRVIEMTRPVLSLLLEPRSLVITTQQLYTDHLHGIDPLSEDVFLPSSSLCSDSVLTVQDSVGNYAQAGVRVANSTMIKDPKLREIVTNGGKLKRDARISLTCRDVENVVQVKSLR